MSDDDDKDTWDFVGSTLLVLAFLAFIVLIFVYRIHSVENTCQQKFGNSWHARTAAYSPDVCVNSNGDVKYP